MALRVKKIGEIEELSTHLRGGIIGGRDIRKGIAGNIDGKTLDISAPSGTVTFATTPSGDQVGLSAKDILTQINTVHAGLAHIDSQGRLVLEVVAGTTAVALDATSTGATLFGFSENGETGKIFSRPGGTVPSLVSIGQDALGGGTYLLTTDE
jgi:hypothetical protein